MMQTELETISQELNEVDIHPYIHLSQLQTSVKNSFVQALRLA